MALPNWSNKVKLSVFRLTATVFGTVALLMVALIALQWGSVAWAEVMFLLIIFLQVFSLLLPTIGPDRNRAVDRDTARAAIEIQMAGRNNVC